MAKISAIIIAKDAEEMIADCLDSVSFCDEIIVIDNASTDRTVEIAKHFGAKVFQDTGHNFAELRNFGQQKAKSKWILYIDTDERLSPELVLNIKNIVLSTKDDKYSGYKVLRKNFYFGNHEWPTVEKLERLFRKNDLEGWFGEVHETAKVKGEVGELEGFLLHYTHRDLTSMVEKTIQWSKIGADLRFKAHHPQMSWWRFIRVMITAFNDSFIKQKGYKAGTAGLVEGIYQAFSMFITYAKLWERQEDVKHKT